MINVTRSAIPDLETYMDYLRGVWERGHFTNFGPLCQQLEKAIQESLQASHFFYVGNGTLALQLAIKALEKKGEIITTPFSYVATVSSIAWEGCTPVFADIDPLTLTLDPASIEAQITENTVAILATHVYGNPCDVEGIKTLADRHGLSVIYDAAHAFGVQYKGKALVNYGDIATLSFHATKLFHTVEGGGIVTSNDLLAHRLGYMRNFGHNGPEAFQGLGINAKNSELHAAMGLCNLPHVEKSIVARKAITEMYDAILVDDQQIQRPTIRPGTDYNYAYYPILLESESALLQVVGALQQHQINPRRYFYPSLNHLPYVKRAQVPVAEDIARRVLCLPLFDALTERELVTICRIVLNCLLRKAA